MNRIQLSLFILAQAFAYSAPSDSCADYSAGADNRDQSGSTSTARNPIAMRLNHLDYALLYNLDLLLWVRFF